MPLYTGNVFSGEKQKKKGLVRYLTISRLSDNYGKNPEERLWKADKYDLFDFWLPNIAPIGKNVNDFYQGKIDWNEFSKRYQSHLTSEQIFPFLLKLTREAIEYDLNDSYKGIVLQCVCPSHEHCHRKLLAERISDIARDRFNNDDLRIIHLK